MVLRLDKGLFQLDDFNDYHAILGVSVDATPEQIRRQYLQIVRRLHPDRLQGDRQQLRDTSTLVLARVVNPAYNALSQPQRYQDHLLVLQAKAQQARARQISIRAMHEAAQKLAISPQIRADYQALVQQLSTDLYSSLSEIEERINQLSELNLVYLQRNPGVAETMPMAKVTVTPVPAAATAATQGEAAPVATGATSTSERVASYLRRAEDYVSKQAFAPAIAELRDALRLDANDSRCHALMGSIYLQQNQLTMARVSIRRALALDPQNAQALEAQRQLAQQDAKAAPPPPPKGKRGLLGGWFSKNK
ncbi:J domain-containing protein [Synechococcus elongatus]|uniref:Heat shock protein DnaJ-like n=2 Tax=Synechococcus elongatus TaxID=32046 RepID=Q31Q25_SYNE7|nr:J domain-containing protein [Synechococcus elongatus]ABB56844.1 Heat shock protein DnaJ-like [Synechococcus elongatus PCC 7942 = FACHB-805]AJD58628.1 molecular chaperone DnaJ [Synechococcus elongatus UTEX 2973]MBD2588714.1 J domain-containing protein [Synechococcus elongatus FACHB-242]MBD2689698.1 J domain-containing protein [Synechococcus elongatus FACHB-1061]MBD2708304.1 J domain-containing protein [Synechococcus elongatus PCC 7942 = FACHB-805]